MKAIIMAGGEGVRLRPLTGSVPKPLAKLCGRPAVEYILDLLIKHNFTEAVFTLRYKGEMLERYFDNEYYMEKTLRKGIDLRFSYEDEPLGTAGCVKKAASDYRFTDDFLVISGDALCDFNLSAAFEFHKNNKSKVTIITKQVADPREYGLVLTESESGKITGFSEKPSYLNCVSDYANTGIYFLNPSALDLIPDGKMWDFARDVFPKMLKEQEKQAKKNARPLMSYAETGYWCDIGDIDTYVSCQRDILSGKVDCVVNARKISDGIYSESDISSFADVVIKPPCYIGGNVRIGKNSVIEGSVIGDNVTLGANCRITESVILDGVISANELTAEGAVVCENVKIKSNARLSSGAVVGESVVINENASVENDVRVWQNKIIPANTVIRDDFKYGGKNKIEISERGITGDTNIDITPDFAAKVGCALSGLHANNALVACEDNNASKSFKKALLSGISSTGFNSSDCGTATLPMLIHLSKLTLADLIVHIKTSQKTEIAILNGYGLALTRRQERILEGGLNRSEYKNAQWDDFGAVGDIKCADELYISMLNHISSFSSKYDIILNCGNERLLGLLNPVFKRISSLNGEQLIITLNNSGTKAEFRLGKDFKINHDSLILLACLDIFMGGCDVALPADFPSAADILAARYGRKVHRFFSCSNDDTDKEARTTAQSEAFLWDGAYLSLFVLGWITRNNVSLLDAARELPEFSRENRVVVINCPPQRILSRLCAGNAGCGEGIVLDDMGDSAADRVLLRSNKKGNALFLMAESASRETAKSLCDDVEKMIQIMQK